jgi:hypothetical protein
LVDQDHKHDFKGTGRMSIRRVIGGALGLGWVGYVAYSWYSFTGPYAWFAQWQMAHFGSYSSRLTAAIPLFAGLIPAAFIYGKRATAIRRAADPARETASHKRAAWIALVIGVALVAAGVGAGFIGFQMAQMPRTQGAFEIGRSVAPPTAEVLKVTGVARTDLVVVQERRSAGTITRDRYIPFVAPNWHGEPIAFILKTNQDAYMRPTASSSDEGFLRFDSSTRPFMMTTEPSVLNRNALPGAVRAAYEKANIALADVNYVIDQNLQSNLTIYWIVAASSIVAGFLTLVAALAKSIAGRRAAGVVRM